MGDDYPADSPPDLCPVCGRGYNAILSVQRFRTDDGYTFYRVPGLDAPQWADNLDPDRVDLVFADRNGVPVDGSGELLEGRLDTLELTNPKD